MYRLVQYLWLLFVSLKFCMIQIEVTRSNLNYCLCMCLRNTTAKPPCSYVLTVLTVLTAAGYLHMVWAVQMLL